MHLRSVIAVACLAMLPLSQAGAVGTAADSVPSDDLSFTMLARPSVASPLALALERTVDMHLAMVDQTTPFPARDADAAAVAQRLEALQKLNRFVHQTATGLLAAAPEGDAREQLRPGIDAVVAKLEHRLATDMQGLLAHPLVEPQGWFVISRFGAAADYNASRLMALVNDTSVQRVVLARLETLADEGETSPVALRRVAQDIAVP